MEKTKKEKPPRSSFVENMNIQFKDLQTGEITYQRDLLPSQEKFWNDESRYILFSGGYGCGKSMILIMKTIYDAMRQDNNYILFGRKTYAEIQDVLLKDFFEICHPSWIHSYKKTPHPSIILNTFNGKTSEIIFRNLDKFSENEIAGLNLGQVSIDQAEDVPRGIFMALKGRLRRENIQHRVYMSANPALSWLYEDFVDNPLDGYSIIEASTLENEANLPKAYVDDLKTYPKRLFDQFVLGKYSSALFADNNVFAVEFLERLQAFLRDPSQVKEGLKIYKKYVKGHEYQMGVDSAEGAEEIDEKYRHSKKDNAVITIVDKTTEEEVAMFAGRLTPGATAEKAVLFASWFSNPRMVVEMNSMGIATINRLQDLGYDNLYRRYEYDNAYNKRLKKVGFRTTPASKSLLIQRFNDRLRLRNPKIYSRETFNEMKFFVYSDLAGKKGAGAQEGKHDDRVISLLLAFYDDKEIKKSDVKFTSENNRGIINNVVPSVTIKDGKFSPPQFFKQGATAKWTTL